MTRYIVNDAPMGGWIDTETNTSFTDADEHSPIYKEFLAWCEEGNTPGDATPVELPAPVVPEHLLNVGEPMSDDDVVRALHDLHAYFEYTTPNQEYTAATVKTLIRLVVSKLYGTA